MEYLESCLTNWDQKPVTFIIAFSLLLAFDYGFCRGLYDVTGGSDTKKPDNASAPAASDDAAKVSPKRQRPQKSRWFALHTFANLVVCITAAHAVFAALSDPANATNALKFTDQTVFGNASDFPLVMIISVHFYHMAMFTDLNSDDYFHHLMFIPTMGIPGLLYAWGPCQSFLCVFISGLPGGIEYLFLTLDKMGFVTNRGSLKKLAALQNTWCRWPGILIACYHIYIGWVYERLQVPWFFALFVAGLSTFNAIFYGFQAISALTKASIVEQCVRGRWEGWQEEGRGRGNMGSVSLKNERLDVAGCCCLAGHAG
jgi:hypothetical protein